MKIHLTDEQINSIEALAKLVAQCFANMKEAFLNAFETIKRVTLTHEEFHKPKKLINQTRSGWQVSQDTRRYSQVICNKPKNIVRKII